MTKAPPPPPPAPRRLGIYLVGARGNVATTVVAGARAVARGLAPNTGLVTALDPFRALDLAALDDLVFAGCELRPGTLAESAAQIAHEGGAIPVSLLAPLAADFEDIDRRIDPGLPPHPADRTALGADMPGPAMPLGAHIEEMHRRFDRLRRDHRLDALVVVNLASTESFVPDPALLSSPARLATLIDADAREHFGATLLAAYAALTAGCPFVNFTPSVGAELPALDRLARDRGLPYAGKDGKTGETLLKTVLGPMFRARHLRVLSWIGTNLLGNRDGQVLAHPGHRAGKLRGKDLPLREILGPEACLRTAIEYVPSLGDWKTAHDHVHFEGFLGTRMTLQFTWQGCDSALAAPLVLDLARLIDLAARHGMTGAIAELACFFKSPAPEAPAGFHEQMTMLEALAERLSAPVFQKERP